MDIFANVDKAPQELKEKMVRASAAFRRTVEAEKQAKLWADEKIIANAELNATRDDLNSALNRWDPTTNTMTELKTANQ
jgi:hypothetical protein